MEELFEAIKSNDLFTLKYCLQQNAPLNETNSDGETVLHVACHLGHVKIVEFLLRKGVDYDKGLPNGKNALYLACENNRIEVVKTLIKYKIDFSIAEELANMSSLHISVNHGHHKIVKLLLEKMDPNILMFKDYTPLHIACRNGSVKCVKLLIKHHAEINAIANTSPLYFASENGNAKIIEMLLKAGADPNIRTLYLENSCLHIGCKNGNFQAVQLLIGAGIDPNIINKDGLTPLHISVQEEYEEIVEFLLSCNCDVSILDKDKTIAIEIAEKKRNNSLKQLISRYSKIKEIYCEEKTSNSIKIKWNLPLCFVNYKNFILEYGIISNKEEPFLELIETEETTIKLKNLKEFQEYYFRIKVKKNGKDFEWSDVIKFQTLALKLPKKIDQERIFGIYNKNQQMTKLIWNIPSELIDYYELKFNGCKYRQSKDNVYQIEGEVNTVKITPHNRIGFGPTTLKILKSPHPDFCNFVDFKKTFSVDEGKATFLVQLVDKGGEKIVSCGEWEPGFTFFVRPLRKKKVGSTINNEKIDNCQEKKNGILNKIEIDNIQKDQIIQMDMELGFEDKNFVKMVNEGIENENEIKIKNKIGKNEKKQEDQNRKDQNKKIDTRVEYENLKNEKIQSPKIKTQKEREISKDENRIITNGKELKNRNKLGRNEIIGMENKFSNKIGRGGNVNITGTEIRREKEKGEEKGEEKEKEKEKGKEKEKEDIKRMDIKINGNKINHNNTTETEKQKNENEIKKENENENEKHKEIENKKKQKINNFQYGNKANSEFYSNGRYLFTYFVTKAGVYEGNIFYNQKLLTLSPFVFEMKSGKFSPSKSKFQFSNNNEKNIYPNEIILKGILQDKYKNRINSNKSIDLSCTINDLDGNSKKISPLYLKNGEIQIRCKPWITGNFYFLFSNQNECSSKYFIVYPNFNLKINFKKLNLKLLKENSFKIQTFKRKNKRQRLIIQIFPTNFKETSKDGILKDLKKIQNIAHPNLVKILGISYNNNNKKKPRNSHNKSNEQSGNIKKVGGLGRLCIISEYIKGKNLKEIQQKLVFQEKIQILISICRILIYLHSKNIFFYHLKPSNIYFSNNNIQSIKIKKFGMKHVLNDVLNSNIMFKTLKYVDPTLESLKSYKSVNDVFSFGILMEFVMYGNDKMKRKKKQLMKIDELILLCKNRKKIQMRPTFSEIQKKLICFSKMNFSNFYFQILESTLLQTIRKEEIKLIIDKSDNGDLKNQIKNETGNMNENGDEDKNRHESENKLKTKTKQQNFDFYLNIVESSLLDISIYPLEMYEKIKSIFFDFFGHKNNMRIKKILLLNNKQNELNFKNYISLFRKKSKKISFLNNNNNISPKDYSTKNFSINTLEYNILSHLFQSPNIINSKYNPERPILAWKLLRSNEDLDEIIHNGFESYYFPKPLFFHQYIGTGNSLLKKSYKQFKICLSWVSLGYVHPELNKSEKYLKNFTFMPKINSIFCLQADKIQIADERKLTYVLGNVFKDDIVIQNPHAVLPRFIIDFEINCL
ncbi:repeat protein [Anaeramoeba flamelloides]|uniref:Repeat protein n=1 Tax=Anaeramoeba flamelloides TaxID=1746091 RepID=A0ABQ8YHY2_9EUKA|nr:repeat protein [Anaeramoeba flamelloides]